MEEFEQHVGTYRNKIRDADDSLKINEAIHVTKAGEYIVVFSIEAQTGACFGVTLTAISPKKAKLQIEFHNADEDWSSDNSNLFASFICELTNCGLEFDDAKSAVDDMQKSDYCKINRKAYLIWDDYHSALYYTEAFNIASMS